jgi:hypothetical protein
MPQRHGSRRSRARPAEPGTSCKQPSWWEPRSPTAPRVEGSGRAVVACPTPSRKPSPNQAGTRAEPARQPDRAGPASLAPWLAPVAFRHARRPPFPGSKGRAARPARHSGGMHHDRGSRQLRRQPHRRPEVRAAIGGPRRRSGPPGAVGSSRSLFSSSRYGRHEPEVCRERLDQVFVYLSPALQAHHHHQVSLRPTQQHPAAVQAVARSV